MLLQQFVYILRTSHLQDHPSWKVQIDNDFASNFLNSTRDIQPKFQPPEKCCQACSNMLQHQRSVSIKSLETSVKDCWICGELCRSLKVFLKSHCKENSPESDQDEVCNECQKKEIHIVRNGSSLNLDNSRPTLNSDTYGPRVLRICRDPGKKTVILYSIRN